MVTGIELVSVFFLGLAGSFAPCLFPVLPAFLAYVAQSDNKKVNGLIASLLVVAGILTAFLSLSLLLLVSVGDSILDFLSQNYITFRTVQGVILTLLGLVLLLGIGAKMSFFDPVVNWTQNKIQESSNAWVQAYLIGLFFAVLAAPCALVIFGAFVTILVNNATFFGIIGVNIAFALGAGMPFFIIGFIIPAFKESFTLNNEVLFRYIPMITGVLLLILGILTTTGTLDVIVYG